ncbi:hypothetical protein [uncultured virus]|uniref:Uncharacterized protein n=1 Tax=uncultured virus TaxID=340016 RepID=A0A218MKY0_9VIRU|nr:hypothetical protein [uncultured virus]
MINLNNIITTMTPQLARTLVENIKNKVDNIDLGTQTADTSVGYQYSVSGDSGQITISIESGKIQGTQVVDVSEHSRGLSKVRAHQREYEDKRVFELPDGGFITSEIIPESVLEKAVSDSVEEL